MSNNSTNIRPADISDEIIENIVDVWITRGAQPPVHLAEVLKNYHDLMVYVDAPTTSYPDAAKASLTMDKLFDKLKAGAAQQVQVHNQIQAQIRRRQKREAEIRQREYDALPWKEKCNRAIAQWYAGIRV